jgi:hypothetical protein
MVDNSTMDDITLHRALMYSHNRGDNKLLPSWHRHTGTRKEFIRYRVHLAAASIVRIVTHTLYFLMLLRAECKLLAMRTLNDEEEPYLDKTSNLPRSTSGGKVKRHTLYPFQTPEDM